MQSDPQTTKFDGDNISQIRHWVGIARQAIDQDHRAVKFLNEAMHYVEQEEKRYERD